MSRDVLEMVQAMDSQGLEWHLAMQCAPLLVGVKISNLVMLPASCEAAIQRLLAHSELSCTLLRRTEHKVTLLVYREEELRQFLMQAETAELLKAEGYPAGDLQSILSVLRNRYEECRSGEGGFPHEMGLFLGYPAEDVRGFIELGGQNALYSGYWKVYAHVEEKKRIFAAYEEARDTVICLLHGGCSLTDILRKYAKAASLPAAC